MTQFNEALQVLDINNIPYGIVGGETQSEIINIPSKEISRLRRLGFRVGKVLFEDARIVFYKGRCVGITAG